MRYAGFRAHAEGAFYFLVGGDFAPSYGLLVQIMPVPEGAACEVIIFYVGEVSLDPCLPVGIANVVGNKFDSVYLAEPFHLGGDISIGAAASGHYDVRVVNNTYRAGAVHEREGGIQKDPCLKAGEAGIVLDEEFS